MGASKGHGHLSFATRHREAQRRAIAYIGDERQTWSLDKASAQVIRTAAVCFLLQDSQAAKYCTSNNIGTCWNLYLHWPVVMPSQVVANRRHGIKLQKKNVWVQVAFCNCQGADKSFGKLGR